MGENNDYGPQGLIKDDVEFEGTAFKEIKETVFQNSYQEIWGTTGQLEFPVYPVTWSSIFQGTLLHKKSNRKYCAKPLRAHRGQTGFPSAGAPIKKGLRDCCTPTASSS